jgi:hypothetical protein
VFGTSSNCANARRGLRAQARYEIPEGLRDPAMITCEHHCTPYDAGVLLYDAIELSAEAHRVFPYELPDPRVDPIRQPLTK